MLESAYPHRSEVWSEDTHLCDRDILCSSVVSGNEGVCLVLRGAARLLPSFFFLSYSFSYPRISLLTIIKKDLSIDPSSNRILTHVWLYFLNPCHNGQYILYTVSYWFSVKSPFFPTSHRRTTSLYEIHLSHLLSLHFRSLIRWVCTPYLPSSTAA